MTAASITPVRKGSGFWGAFARNKGAVIGLVAVLGSLLDRVRPVR